MADYSDRGGDARERVPVSSTRGAVSSTRGMTELVRMPLEETMERPEAKVISSSRAPPARPTLRNLDPEDLMNIMAMAGYRHSDITLDIATVLADVEGHKRVIRRTYEDPLADLRRNLIAQGINPDQSQHYQAMMDLYPTEAERIVTRMQQEPLLRDARRRLQQQMARGILYENIIGRRPLRMGAGSSSRDAEVIGQLERFRL